MKLLIFLILIFVLCVLVATMVYSYLEGWDFIDSLHYVTTLATTVGNDKKFPENDTSKIVDIIFMILTAAFFIIIVSYIYNIIVG